MVVNPFPVKTKIHLLRRDGRGLEGTYANAHHHAQRIIPLVDALKPYGDQMGFADWYQGHNVHKFVTVDGRSFTLRPFINSGEYRGVRLCARLSRSFETFLMDITQLCETSVLVDTMKKLAEPPAGDPHRLMKTKAR